jgi:hypothetical protein
MFARSALGPVGGWNKPSWLATASFSSGLAGWEAVVVLTGGAGSVEASAEYVLAGLT